jgi:predicted nucleotidyltransferase
MKTINEIRQILSLPKQSLYEIYQITEIGIFSSYARESRQK